jgi:hypothetical protein
MSRRKLLTALALAWGSLAVADARLAPAGDRASGPAVHESAAWKTRVGCSGPGPFMFGAATSAPACWRPYGGASPFNRRLGGNPRLVKRSTRIVRGTLATGSVQDMLVGHPQSGNDDFGHPVYYAGGLDPVYEIRCARWVRHCEVHEMRVRIPPVARPASGSDGHMAVVDPSRAWEYDFLNVQTVPLPPNGGRITVDHGGRTHWGARSDGLGSHATAAHFGLAAGMLRAEEWQAATISNGSIKHALFIAVRCTSGGSVYPAASRATGSVCRDPDERASAPPLGTRFYLEMSGRRINRLSVPAWKRPILRAMANYGMIVGDTIGGDRHSFGVVTESDAQYTSFGESGRFAQLGRAWGAPVYQGAYVFNLGSGVKWRRHLRVVRPCVSRGSC